MPKTTNEKCFLTNGMLPKKYPAPVQISTHVTQALTLYLMNFLYEKSLVAATNGTNVRMIGMKRARKIAMAPYLSKKPRALFKSDCLMNLPKTW